MSCVDDDARSTQTASVPEARPLQFIIRSSHGSSTVRHHSINAHVARHCRGSELPLKPTHVCPRRNCALYHPTFRGRKWPQRCFQTRKCVLRSGRYLFCLSIPHNPYPTITEAASNSSKIPTVAILVAVTTRNVHFNQSTDLSLFKVCTTSSKPWRTAASP
jgi:hypothetical protein